MKPSTKALVILFGFSIYILLMYQLPHTSQVMGLSKKHIETDAYLTYQEVDLRIIVIVYDRYISLLRLLISLNKALYFNDRVVLEVWIDRSVENNTIDEKTYKAANVFVFKHGKYVIHKQTRHVGIYGQWINTWNPSNDTNELAVILEDDLTVSPYFYQWLKLVREKYGNISSISGFALQGESGKHGKYSEGLVEGPPGEVVFLYPILGTWGYSPKRENWLRFQKWFHETSKNKTFHPLVPDTKCTEWYKTFIMSNKTHTMWSMWHVYYSFLHKEETLYSNFPDHKGLARNWKPKGLHHQGGEKPTPILTEWNTSYEQLPDRPVHLDLDSNVVPEYDPYASTRKHEQ